VPGSDRFLHGSLQQEVLVHTVLFKGNVHCLYPTNGTRDDWVQVLLVILEATGNVAYNDDTAGNWSMYITNSNLIFPGWLLVCVIALLVD